MQSGNQPLHEPILTQINGVTRPQEVNKKIFAHDRYLHKHSSRLLCILPRLHLSPWWYHFPDIRRLVPGTTGPLGQQRCRYVVDSLGWKTKENKCCIQEVWKMTNTQFFFTFSFTDLFHYPSQYWWDHFHPKKLSVRHLPGPQTNVSSMLFGSLALTIWHGYPEGLQIELTL